MPLTLLALRILNMPSADRMAPRDTRSVAWKPSWVSVEYMTLHWAGKLAAFQANCGSATQGRETIQAALASQGQDCNLAIPAYCTGSPSNITLCADEVHPERPLQATLSCASRLIT